MNLLSSIRKHLFWTVDSLKGGTIKKHYNEIKYLNENYGSEKYISTKEQNISNIINHTLQTTPYYKKLNINAYLNEFPVINKNVVRDNYDDFKSTKHKEQKNTAVFTGGSTGTPFKLFHDKNKRNRHTADNLYFAEKGGYDLGDRLYLLRAWHKKDVKSMALFIKKNIKPYYIMNYSDEDMENMLLDFKNDPSIKSIVCFASMCDILVNYLDSFKAEPQNGLNIKSIVTDGDSLSKSTKDKMENYFQTATVARYGNMECGIMGQQKMYDGYDYSLNCASYHFELLDLKEDKPVKPGEMGRIVVTDLFNYCMPLIRYDTGDMASFKEQGSAKNIAPVFERIEGRIVDLIYNTSGKVISPYTVVQKMQEYFELKQFQFAQTSTKEYVFRLNPWDTFTKEEELIKDSKTYLGQDAMVTLKYVEEIPFLSSGKRKQVVNEM